MKRLLQFLQFAPIAVFIYVSKHQGWEHGFEVGAIAAALEFVLLFAFKLKISRLIGGANLFLLFGGVAFALHVQPMLQLLEKMRESAVFVSVALVMLISTFATQSGAFEASTSTPEVTKRYSLILIAFTLGCAVWSWYHKGNTVMAGTVPFIALILVKLFLQKKIVTTPNY